MWRPVVVTTPPTGEPITLEAAKRQVRVEIDDTYYDADLGEILAAARAHVERVTGTKLYTQEVGFRTDCWSDLCHLPVAPVQSLSIEYVDSTGATQTLDPLVYDARLEGLEPEVVLKFNQSWPEIQARSLISVTAVVGYGDETEQEPDVIHAIKLAIGDMFAFRETASVGALAVSIPAAGNIEALLANHKIHLI